MIKNDKVVYLHRNTDGKIFYIGSGNYKRAYVCNKSARSEAWHQFADKGYVVEIVATGLERKAAFDLEDALIIKYRDTHPLTAPLTNKELASLAARSAGLKNIATGQVKKASIAASRPTISLDDGKITAKSHQTRYEAKTGYKHIWIDL